MREIKSFIITLRTVDADARFAFKDESQFAWDEGGAKRHVKSGDAPSRMQTTARANDRGAGRERSLKLKTVLSVT